MAAFCFHEADGWVLEYNCWFADRKNTAGLWHNNIMAIFLANFKKLELPIVFINLMIIYDALMIYSYLKLSVF